MPQTGVPVRSRLLPILLATAALAAAARPAQAQGTGVYGEYFDNLDFVPTAATRDGERIDADINFNWGLAVPVPQGLFRLPIDALPPGIFAMDTWSARWSGVIEAPVTGNYIFQTTADDGVRIYVDGRLLVDRWRDQSVTTSSPLGISLIGGRRYGLRVDYYQFPGDARVQLLWNVPGSGTLAVVPTANLYPDVAAPKIFPAAGTVSDSVTVTMECDTFGAEVWYTVDGSPPVPAAGSAALYAGPFVLVTNTTVRAIARRTGTLLTLSAATTSAFAINDILRPSIVTAKTPLATQVVVVFSEAVEAVSAQAAGNYAMTGGVGVTGAVLSGDFRTVFLTTTAMTPGTPYTLTVAGVTDRDVPPNPIAPGSGIAFIYPNFPAASLQDYYPFEEGAGTATADLGPAANAGTLAGATGVPAWILGYLGRGLRFDGVDDQVTLAANLQPILGGTATLACWIRTSGQGNIPIRAPGIAGGVMTVNGLTTDTNDILWGWLDENGRIGITAGLTVDAGTNPEPVPPNPQTNTAQSANPINDGQWHHVALTRNEATGALQVYIDGLLGGSAVGETGIKTAPCTSIGRVTNAQGSATHPIYFLGDLDDLRTFNTVLTQTEIRTIANRPPVVDAGPDQSLSLGQPAPLAGTVADDGFPAGTTTALWTATGPGIVTFLPNASTLSASAGFSTPGIYVLRLTGSDGSLATSDELIVNYAMVSVTPGSISTAEAGPGTAVFSVVLTVAPLANVTIAVSSSDTTEATVSAALLTFTTGNWNVPQPVIVTGVDDPQVDGNVAYTIILDPATSSDPAFNGFNAVDVAGLNLNDDLPPLPKKAWGNCGATGLEALVPLGLLWLLRRRSARR